MGVQPQAYARAIREAFAQGSGRINSPCPLDCHIKPAIANRPANSSHRSEPLGPGGQRHRSECVPYGPKQVFCALLGVWYNPLAGWPEG